MDNTTTQPRPELLQMADVLAREKGIDRDDVLQAMEYAIARAGRSKYGPQYDVRATIDRKTGEIKMARYTTVVETVEEEGAQISLQDAHKINPDLKLGDEIVDPLPPMDFGRIAAQTAKQVIVQKVRDAERVRQYNDFKVIFNGGVESKSSVKSFKWLSVCDTSEIEGGSLKEQLQQSQEAINQLREQKKEEVKQTVNAVKESAKQTTEDIKNQVQNVKDSIDEIKNLFKKNRRGGGRFALLPSCYVSAALPAEDVCEHQRSHDCRVGLDDESRSVHI